MFEWYLGAALIVSVLLTVAWGISKLRRKPYVPPVRPPHPAKALQAAMQAVVDDPKRTSALPNQTVRFDADGISSNEAVARRFGSLAPDIVIEHHDDSDIANAYEDVKLAHRLQGPNRRLHANRNPMSAGELDQLIASDKARQASLEAEIQRDAQREAETLLDDEKRAALFADGGQEAVNRFLVEVVRGVMDRVNAGSGKLAGQITNAESTVAGNRRLREGLLLTGVPRDESGYTAVNPVLRSPDSPANIPTGA